MDAVRCKDCGETRWSLFGGSIGHLLAEPCRICGGETVVERRRPGGRPLRPFTERRDADRAESRQPARRGS
jgi:hypothetical protein